MSIFIMTIPDGTKILATLASEAIAIGTPASGCCCAADSYWFSGNVVTPGSGPAGWNFDYQIYRVSASTFGPDQWNLTDPSYSPTDVWSLFTRDGDTGAWLLTLSCPNPGTYPGPGTAQVQGGGNTPVGTYGDCNDGEGNYYTNLMVSLTP